MPAGIKANAANVSHHIFPDLTERLSATIAKRESDKGPEVPPTNGAVFEPMAEGRTVDGGIRERMRREDREARERRDRESRASRTGS